MAGLSPVELTADCDACRLEGGVIEVYDALSPACRFGLPSTARCKLCALTREGVFDRAPQKPMRDIPANRCPACLEPLLPIAVDGRRCTSCGAQASLAETGASIRFETLEALEAALDAWATSDGFSTRDALVSATFVATDVGRLFELYRAGERLESLADPFANMGVRTARRANDDERPPAAATPSPATAGVVARPAPAAPTVAAVRPHAASVEAPLPVDPTAPTEPLAPPLLPAKAAPPTSVPPPPSAPPRAIVYPLVSVIVADGEIHPEELALVDRFLQGEGLAPLAPHEYCVHHPSEVAHFVPRERREDVVKLMCESAAVDGMPDESERRVIRAYATAWGVDDEKLDFWMWGYEEMNTSVTRALWLKLRRFVLSARWNDPE